MHSKNISLTCLALNSEPLYIEPSSCPSRLLPPVLELLLLPELPEVPDPVPEPDPVPDPVPKPVPDLVSILEPGKKEMENKNKQTFF